MSSEQFPGSIGKRSSSVVRIADVRALLASRLIQSFAASAIGTVVAFQTYEITGDPFALGLLGLVEAIPALAFAFVGGHMADRRDRRNIVIVASSVLTIGSLILGIASLTPTLIGLPLILAVAFAVGVGSGFEHPALAALEAQVIPIEHAATGTSWIGSTWLLGGVLGPLFGGVGIATLGLPGTYAIITSLLVIATACIALIPRKAVAVPAEEQSVIESVTSGIQYVVGNQVLVGSITLDFFAVFFGGALAMLPVFAEETLKVGPVGLGLLRTAPAAGALLAMVATARFPPRRMAGPAFLASVASFGISMIAFGLSSILVISVVALFLGGFADGVSMVIRGIIMRVESPEVMRGRIASVNAVFLGASSELGAFESGIAASVVGLVPSVVAGGAVTIGATGVVALLAPQIRKLDLAHRLIAEPGARY